MTNIRNDIRQMETESFLQLVVLFRKETRQLAQTILYRQQVQDILEEQEQQRHELARNYQTQWNCILKNMQQSWIPGALHHPNASNLLAIVKHEEIGRERLLSDERYAWSHLMGACDVSWTEAARHTEENAARYRQEAQEYRLVTTQPSRNINPSPCRCPGPPLSRQTLPGCSQKDPRRPMIPAQRRELLSLRLKQFTYRPRLTIRTIPTVLPFITTTPTTVAWKCLPVPGRYSIRSKMKSASAESCWRSTRLGCESSSSDESKMPRMKPRLLALQRPCCPSEG